MKQCHASVGWHPVRIFKQLSFLILIGLSGCGFHFRGHTPPQQTLTNLSVVPYAPYSATYQFLEQAFLNRHVVINPANPIYTLTLLGDQLDTYALAYGTDGRLRKEKYIYILRYSLEDAAHQKLIPENRIVVEREQYFNPNQDLADEQEKKTLQQDMRQEAIRLLVDEVIFWQ
jgi:LPS-assembly lipoprotein